MLASASDDKPDGPSVAQRLVVVAEAGDVIGAESNLLGTTPQRASCSLHKHSLLGFDFLMVLGLGRFVAEHGRRRWESC
jgi:hypothetical protein